MTPTLTIAVPTFDRPEQLRKAVAVVLPQLTPAVRLLVVDNHSPRPASEVLASLLADRPGVDVRVARNSVNIGGAANVLRCIELCDTPWVWVVGDDDRLRPGAVAAVLADLATHPDTAVFNYSSTFHTRTADATLTGADELLDLLDSLGGLLFITATVLNNAAIRPHLAVAHQFVYTFSPHLALTLSAAAVGGVIRLRVTRLEDADQSGYSRLTIVLGFATLLDLPTLTHHQRASLGRRLRHTFCSFDRLVSQLVFETARHGDVWSSLYYFDQLYARLFYFEPNPLARLKARAARPLVRFPRLGRWLLRSALRLRYPVAEVDRIEFERGGTARLERL